MGIYRSPQTDKLASKPCTVYEDGRHVWIQVSPGRHGPWADYGCQACPATVVGSEVLTADSIARIAEHYAARDRALAA